MALLPGVEAVVDAEAGEPAEVVVHAGRKWGGRIGAGAPQAKREGGATRERGDSSASTGAIAARAAGGAEARNTLPRRGSKAGSNP
jgi:hypothetical protein